MEDYEKRMQDIYEEMHKLVNELAKENKELKLKKIPPIPSPTYPPYYFNDIFRHPQNNMCIYPQNEENIYHRTSRQLQEHLNENGFPADCVSRSHVGNISYFNVEFNINNDEWSYDNTSDFKIRQLLDIEGVGLVDFYKHDDIVHEVILIDEKELKDKYLFDGNFDFKRCKDE